MLLNEHIHQTLAALSELFDSVALDAIRKDIEASFIVSDFSKPIMVSERLQQLEAKILALRHQIPNREDRAYVKAINELYQAIVNLKQRMDPAGHCRGCVKAWALNQTTNIETIIELHHSDLDMLSRSDRLVDHWKRMRLAFQQDHQPLLTPMYQRQIDEQALKVQLNALNPEHTYFMILRNAGAGHAMGLRFNPDHRIEIYDHTVGQKQCAPDQLQNTLSNTFKKLATQGYYDFAIYPLQKARLTVKNG